MSEHKSFSTVIGCMDGRGQEPARRLARRITGARHSDTITEAGMVGLLAGPDVDPALKESVRHKALTVSVGKHHSDGIIVWGHPDCAGNPVPDAQHIVDVFNATKTVREIIDADVPVVGAFMVPRKVLPGWRAALLEPDKPVLARRTSVRRKR